MLWVLLGIVLTLIVVGHYWEPPERKPLARQPKDHFSTFSNRAAVHEAGHVVAAWCCTLVHKIGDITIEHKQGGVTAFWTIQKESPESHWCYIVILLSGMAAEMSAYGKTRSGGCGPDLESALEKAKLIAKSGSSDPPWGVPPCKYTPDFANMITALDPVHKRILTASYCMAYSILEAHGNDFYRIVTVLLTRKTASASDIESVLGPRAFIKLMGIPVAKGWVRPTFILPIMQA